MEWVLEGPSAASGAWDGLSSGKSSVRPSIAQSDWLCHCSRGGTDSLPPLCLPFSPPWAGFIAAIRRQGQQEWAQKPISGLFTLSCWFISSDRKKSIELMDFFSVACALEE